MDLINVVCLGDSNAKKTELMCVLTDRQCACDEYACIHNKMKDCFTCRLHITDPLLDVEIRIFSTVDTDYPDLDCLGRINYAKAEVMLLVFNLDNPSTLRGIQNRWLNECFTYAKSAKILLVGVQSDTTATNTDIHSIITDINTKYHLPYQKVCLESKDDIKECYASIIELVYGINQTKKKRRSIGEGFSTIKKKGTRILQKLLPEKQEDQDTEKSRGIHKKHEQDSTTEQSELHAVFNKHDSQIFRHFIVDKVLPLRTRDLKSLGLALGYDQKALKLPSHLSELIKKPFWQMLKFWTEQTDDLQIIRLPLMYCSLMNIKQKGIANDLLVSVKVHYTDDSIRKRIENKFTQRIETDEMLKLKAKLKLFMFSLEADQIPPVIWKMGKSAGALYKDILQAGTESRHCIRLMIVGPFGVGKTCLMRRLLKKGINDVKSTNGINIMVLRCKVRLSDETWIFSDELIDHAEQDRQRRLYKHLIQPRQHIPEQSSTDKITYNQTHAQSGEVKGQLQDRFDINLTSTGISSNNEYILSTEVQKAVDEKPKTEESFELNRQQETRITFQKSEEGLLKDFHGLQISAESMDDFAEVVMLDFAGQYEFYATHQTFLNKHAVYLLVLDISKDLKGSLTSEDQDDVLTDLAEIPLEDIGEYVNFWMDAIHCYSENEDSEDKSEHDLPSVFENKSEQTLPSVIVVGTCSDKLEEKGESRRTEIVNQLNEILGDHVKKEHIKDFIILSNLSKSEEQFDLLRETIFGLASKVNTWGQKLPVRWIKLEQRLDILRTKDNKTVISYVDVIEHGKQVDPAIHNEKEIKLFLNYQHEMGNIIFFEDIPEYIILQPQWLVDVLKCLISAPKFQKEKQLLHSSDWIELETTGRLSEDLLTEIFSQTSLSYSVPYKYHVLKVMEKFDIIVKPSVSKGNNLSRQSTFEDSMFDQYRVTPNEELDENLESSNLNETTDPELSEDEFSDVFYGSVSDSIDYYVPSLIKTKPIRNVVENFNVTGNQCKRSSWLCMDFYFLPPAFFNHLLVGYIRRYPISIEPSKRCTKLALYRGMGVFNLDQSGCIKLAICVFCNVVQFQVWYWKEPSVERNEQVWEEAELSVNAIIRRYKMNVKYTLKIKCMSGSYNNPIGMVDVKQLKNLESYFCNDHAESHKSKDILGCWIQDEKTNKTDESLLKVAETTELEAKLNRHFQKIVNEIGPLGQILDDMISQCLISTDNRSYIEQYPDKQNQTRRLLNILIGRGQEVYSAFLEILRKHGYQKFSENLEHDHVTQENTFDNKQDLSTWKVPLFRVRLQKNYTDIVSTIKHENIVDYLITKEVFNIDDKDIIDAYPAQSDKNRKLMEKLMYTEERGYYHFLTALRKDDCYVELANQIEKTNVTSNDNLLLTDCSKLPGQDDINYR